MKITLCGSIAFYDEMLEVKKQLEEKGFEVKLPPAKVKGKDNEEITVKEYYEIRKGKEPEPWVWDRKKEAILAHYSKIEWADSVLITNFDKKGIEGYIGANTLIEMGIALYLNKPIYLLKKVPELDSKEEILGMKPILINNNLDLIK